LPSCSASMFLPMLRRPTIRSTRTRRKAARRLA